MTYDEVLRTLQENRDHVKIFRLKNRRQERLGPWEPSCVAPQYMVLAKGRREVRIRYEEIVELRIVKSRRKRAPNPQSLPLPPGESGMTHAEVLRTLQANRDHVKIFRLRSRRQERLGAWEPSCVLPQYMVFARGRREVTIRYEEIVEIRIVKSRRKRAAI